MSGPFFMRFLPNKNAWNVSKGHLFAHKTELADNNDLQYISLGIYVAHLGLLHACWPSVHYAFYYGKVVEKAQSMDNWRDKIFAFIKGPGWFPGTPRLGDPTGVPEIQHRPKYDPQVAGWVNVYAVLHFVLVFLAFDDLGRYNLQMTQTGVLTICVFLFWTLTSIGMVFDKSSLAWPSELLRSAVFLTLYVKMGAWNEFMIPYEILIGTFTVSMIISSANILARSSSKIKMT